MSLDDLVMPLESSEFIVQNSKSVSINQEAVGNLAQKVFYFVNI